MTVGHLPTIGLIWQTNSSKYTTPNRQNELIIGIAMNNITIMSAKTTALFFIFLTAGCRFKEHPDYEFKIDALALKYVREDWISKGRPPGYNITNYVGPVKEFLNYTNTITITNKAFHCVFACHRSVGPKGILAITEEGITLWLSDGDGKVTISPEINGVEH